MTALFDSVIQLIITFISEIGYLGIFIGMFLESTLVPIPSELVMIPVGIAAVHGVVNIYLATIVGILGNVCGAIFFYYVALHFGRGVLFRVGKYFFIKPELVNKIEVFFKSHGSISVFIGRILPGFRHFISFFAGLAKMNKVQFIYYTAAGSAIWTTTLSAIGYMIGENEKLVKEYLNHALIVVVIVCPLIIFFYVKRKKSHISKSDPKISVTSNNS